MAAIQDLLVGIDENTATATGTATATATQAAPGTDHQLFITGFSISVGVAPTTAGVAQLRFNGGATVLKNLLLPAALMAPIIYEFKRPIRIPANMDSDITVTGWTTATVRVELYTITRVVTGA